MKQPHTETAVQHTDDDQNTGNHLKTESGLIGSDKIGGTRTGAENVEGKANSGETKDAPPPGQAAASATAKDDGQPKTRSPETDERGRL